MGKCINRDVKIYISEEICELKSMKNQGVIPPAFNSSLREKLQRKSIEQYLETSKAVFTFNDEFKKLAKKNNIDELINSLGIDQFAFNSSLQQNELRKQSENCKTDLHRLADLFINIFYDLRKNFKINDLFSFSSNEIEKLKLSMSIFSDYLKEIDWKSITSLDSIPFSKDLAFKYARNLGEKLGYDHNELEIRQTKLPFWGQNFDLELYKKSVVLVGDLSGIKILPVLLHEIGHAIDNLSWTEDDINFYFRRPFNEETMAYLCQNILENKKLLNELKHENLPPNLPSMIKINKIRELAYMFILIELDMVLLYEENLSTELLIQSYSDLCMKYFNMGPPSDYSFIKEQIHFLYPGYMINYLYAELASFHLRNRIEKLNDLKSINKQVHNNTQEEIMQNIEKITKDRIESLRRRD